MTPNVVYDGTVSGPTHAPFRAMAFQRPSGELVVKSVGCEYWMALRAGSVFTRDADA
jgi:hypothetical protein